MRTYIDGRVRRMDAIVDRAEAGWCSEAATVYRKLHREAEAEAVGVWEILGVLVQAVWMSRDGFTRQELDTLRQFRAEVKCARRCQSQRRIMVEHANPEVKQWRSL
ncbi:hypothetical protein [Streptomyces sp. NPDC056549]|uniref:hypothetical protein n=1 Tax=Streptomyces sp. NPDC056549 TaxID=3345864 RepID=UPI0036853FC4